MEITFKTCDLAQIMTSCGSIAAGASREDLAKHPWVRYIRMECSIYGCTAIGMDGFKLARVIVPCRIVSGDDLIIFMVSPFRVPERKYELATITDAGKGHIQVKFHNPDSEGSQSIIIERDEGDNYPKKWDTLLPLNRKSTYQIRLGTHHLAGLLKAFKGEKYLDFEFGSCVQPCLVHGENQDVLGMILPVRPGQ